MHYASALSLLNSLAALGIRPGLLRIRALLRELGHPEHGFQVVHVAGSNGKGSVCRMLESVLTEAGHRVGTFISPHLIDFRERFRIGGKPVARADVETCFPSLWQALCQPAILRHGPPTYFEAVTALAFLIFRRRRCKVVVLETGLGGRFDSTNVIRRPLLTIITNISLEHTQILGKNLSRIAWEKAGILKPNVPLVTAARGEALRVIRREFAKARGSELRVVCPSAWRGQQCLLPESGQWVEGCFQGRPRRFYIPLLGPHQIENLACALEGILLLRQAGLDIPEETVERGLARAHWPGRLQLLKYRPLLLLDGAHNPAGARALILALRSLKLPRAQVIFGVLRDKNWRAMLQALRPCAQRFYYVKPSDPRGLEPKRILAWKGAPPGRAWPNLRQALAQARQAAGPYGLVLATGSLYSIGEILRLHR